MGLLKTESLKVWGHAESSDPSCSEITPGHSLISWPLASVLQKVFPVCSIPCLVAWRSPAFGLLKIVVSFCEGHAGNSSRPQTR